MDIFNKLKSKKSFDRIEFNDDPKFQRFMDAQWFPDTLSYKAIIGGAGGIGSWLSLLLARMGTSFIIFDADRFEPHNQGGQLVTSGMLGNNKASYVCELVNEFINMNSNNADQRIFPISEHITKSTDIQTIFGNFKPGNNHSAFFSAFDNMKARKILFDKFLTWSSDRGEGVFIDGRLGAEHVQIFCIPYDDKKAIEVYQREHLFSDSDVPDEPCALKQTSHVASLIASLMVSIFTNYVANVRNIENDREVPNHLYMTIPFLYFESEKF